MNRAFQMVPTPFLVRSHIQDEWTLLALKGSEEISSSNLSNLLLLVEIISGDKSYNLIKPNACQLTLSLLGLHPGFHHQYDWQIRVNKKAGPDQEGGAGNSNVQAIPGVPVTEERPWPYVL